MAGIYTMTQYIYDAEGTCVAKGAITNGAAGCNILKKSLQRSRAGIAYLYPFFRFQVYVFQHHPLPNLPILQTCCGFVRPPYFDSLTHHSLGPDPMSLAPCYTL